MTFNDNGFEIPQRGHRQPLPEIPQRRRSERASAPSAPKGNHPELPIYSKCDEIVTTTENNQVTVLAAPTGSGKSTQVPLMMLEAGLAEGGMIGVLQPRRVAAQRLSKWVAQQHGTPHGDVIGYHIGGVRDFFGRNTKVKYMTDGILLGELQSDPLLRKYSVIVLDEVHERSVNIDLVMALLRPVLRQRPDLKLIVMSATLDTQKYSEHFGGAPVIQVPGRMYEVEVRYASATPYSLRETLKACTEKIEELVRSEHGDILVFLPDEASIRQVCQSLDKLRENVRVHALFGNQDPDEQDAVFVIDGQRRVIVATNIAETSLTIDGVRHVIDSGYIKQTVYRNPAMSALQVTDHSKAGCEQRRGRAGRTAPGICHRLMKYEDFQDRPAHTTPELLRISLDAVLLQLRCLGYTMEKILGLEFPDPPGEDRWREAEARLRTFGALDDESTVTEDGRLMNRLPISPMLARMILAGVERGCVKEMATIVAFEAARSVMLRGRTDEDKRLASLRQAAFKHPSGDVLTYLKLWNAYTEKRRDYTSRTPWWEWAKWNYLSSKAFNEIERARDEILYRLQGERYKGKQIELSSSDDMIAIRKAAAAGLIVNLCVLTGRNDYTWAHGSDVFIHPGSSLFETKPRLMVCSEVVQTTRAFARGCTAIEKQWIPELIPESELTVKWSLEAPFMYGDGAMTLRRSVTWQNMALEASQEVEEIPWDDKSLMTCLVTQIVETLWGIGYHSEKILWNMSILKQTWREICQIRWNMAYYHTIEETVRSAATILLSAQVARQLEAAKPRTVRELQMLTLQLRLEDWISEEQVGVHKARIERERAFEEDRQRRETEIRMAREARKEAAMAGVRAQHEELTKRIQPYGTKIGYEVRYELSSAGRMITDGFYSNGEIQAKLSRVALAINRFESEQTEGLKLTALAWKATLEHFPTCPLCGSAWEKNDGELICRNTAGHDTRRLVPIGIEQSRMIAHLKTNRENFVASVVVHNHAVIVDMSVLEGQPWPHKSFKSIALTTVSVVLPESLVDERDEIIDDVEALREMKRQQVAQSERVRLAKTKHGRGKTKRLTFTGTTDGAGRPSVKSGIYLYTVPYDEMLTVQDGGTWLCKLGVKSGRDTSAHPLFKIEVSHDDVSEMIELLKESYEGIPEALLS